MWTPPAGITFQPTNGTPTVNVQGIQNPGSSSGSSGNSDYGSWDGDWFGYLNYMAEHGDSASLDRLYNFFMTDYFDKSARSWTEEIGEPPF